jgi:hypothetical protein
MRKLLTAALSLSCAISPAFAGASLQCPYSGLVGSVIIANSPDANRICEADCAWRQVSGRGRMAIFAKISVKAGQTETVFRMRSTRGRIIALMDSSLKCPPNEALVADSKSHTRLRGGVLTTH